MHHVKRSKVTSVYAGQNPELTGLAPDGKILNIQRNLVKT